jgi:hypothetical protein
MAKDDEASRRKRTRGPGFKGKGYTAFRSTTKQKPGEKGQLRTTDRQGDTGRKTVSTVKVRKPDGTLRSLPLGKNATKRGNVVFGRVRGRLPPGLNPLGKLGGFLPALLASSPTNMVTIKGQDGKSQRVPDTFAAKIKEVDSLQKKANTLSFDDMFEEAAKLNMAGFEWEGKSYLTKTKDPEHKYNVYDLTQKKIKADKEEGDVSITYKGAYLGSRPKTMTEGVDEAKSKQPSKTASKTGLSKNSGPKLASGGFVTKRGPLKRKS